MIFHISIPAREPERVAKVIAKLWQGDAFPFPPLHGNGSWVAFADDERVSAIECYPAGARIYPSTEAYPKGFTVKVDNMQNSDAIDDGHIATHAAIFSPLDQAALEALAKREGWLCRYAQRGDFHVIEFWLENSVMLEVLPEALKREYLATQSRDMWRSGYAATLRASSDA